jgi:hypothetical protein
MEPQEKNNAISYKQVEEKVLALRGQNVILDSDVAELYGVETREIRNRPKIKIDKYIINSYT